MNEKCVYCLNDNNNLVEKNDKLIGCHKCGLYEEVLKADPKKYLIGLLYCNHEKLASKASLVDTNLQAKPKIQLNGQGVWSWFKYLAKLFAKMRFSSPFVYIKYHVLMYFILPVIPERSWEAFCKTH